MNIQPVQGRKSSPTAAKIAGRTCVFEANEQKLCQARIEFVGDNCRVTMASDKGEWSIDFGYDQWLKGTAAIDGGRPQAVAGSYAWTTEGTITLKLFMYQTPFLHTVTWQFEGDAVTVLSRVNVSFGPTKSPPVAGRLAATT